jgi:hypothetical protein
VTVVALLMATFMAFAALLVVLMPTFGVPGFFYAWLGANIVTVVLGFLLALQDRA